MNLIDLFTLKEIDIFNHIVMKKDYSNGLNFIKKGTSGKVIKRHYKLRTYDIYFENDIFLENVPVSFLDLKEGLTPIEAMDIIEEFQGHHCDSYKEYQFNIKMYRARIPQEIYDTYDEDLIYTAYHHLLEDTLMTFVPDSFSDLSVLSFFSWIDTYFIAGRSGGYIVLRCKHNYVDDYVETNEEFIATLKDDPDDYIDYEACLKMTYGDLLSAQRELIDFAYDLQMIEKLVELYKNRLYEMINDAQFWHDYLSEY